MLKILAIIQSLDPALVLGVTSIIVIPLIIWGVAVEKRLEKVDYNYKEIQSLKIQVEIVKQHIDENKLANQSNFDKVLEKLHKIELSLKDKQDK